MKFLLDENISQTLKCFLNDSGFKAEHVLDVELGNATDDEIIVFAKKKKLIILTHDKDFGNLIRFPIQTHYGVILLRFKNQKPQNVSSHLINFLIDHKNLKSKLVILREDGFRIVQ